MRRIMMIFLMLSIMLLSGCSSESKAEERCFQSCADCLDEVDRWVNVSGGDQICAKCLIDREYLICKQCRLAYSPEWDDESADGYCGYCSETKTWYCSICENRIDLDELADFGNGYYLCGRCLLNHIEIPEGMADDLAACSPFISRNEYLENIND